MSREVVTTVNPASGARIAAYPAMTREEVDGVLVLVDRARPGWAATTVHDRAAVLRRTAQALRRRSAELAAVATAEMGKPITQSVAEVEKCAWVCDYYADSSPTLLADHEVVTGGSSSWISYEPLGTILAVMPWNFPFWQVFRFAAPTLMAGNAALLKHAPNVTGSALLVEDILSEAGLPDHVFRTLVVAEPEVPAIVERLVADSQIDAVTLTGSNLAGSQVAAAAGRFAKKSVLELGGSDPFVVLDDADLDIVVDRAVAARFLNSGQSCLCAKRFIVHASLVDEFSSRLTAAVRDLVLGDPADPGTQIGPLARPDLAAALHGQVDRSVAAGARVLIGGHLLERGPAWYAPTVIVDVTSNMAVMAEETFGPVAAIAPFETDDDAVTLANDTPFGLGASVWSDDQERALAVGRRLRSGSLFINATTASDPRLPFGGVKQSGYGRELGEVGATEFTNIRTVLVG